MASVHAQEAAAPDISSASVQTLIADGTRLSQQKQYDEALKYFEAALQKDPQSAEAYFYAGTIYIILKQHEKGLEYLERSVSLAPDNIKLRLILAQTYENQSLSEKALAMYQKIKKMAPETREGREAAKQIHIILGKKFGEQGDFEKALEEFNAVLVDQPDDIPALLNKGLTLTYLGKLDEAQTVLENALNLQPRNALLHRYLADVYEKKGMLTEAMHEYEQVIGLVPRDSSLGQLAEVKLTLLRGGQLLNAGKTAEAKSSKKSLPWIRAIRLRDSIWRPYTLVWVM